MEIRTVKPSDTDTRRIAVETDTALAAQYEELVTLRRKQRWAYDSLHRAVGDKQDRRDRWGLTDEAAYFEGERMVEAGEYARNLEGTLSHLRDVEVTIDLTNERVDELGRIYNEYRWNRYFLVTNNNGHVHRGMGCSTCFPTTEYAWLVELASCDEAEMIEEFGEKACTVCFPDAPANPSFHGPGRRDREAQAARQAEKDARNLVKASKNLAADERFRTVYMNDRVETVAGCKEVVRRAIDTAEELKVISTPEFAASYPGDIARFVSNVTDNLGRQEQDAKQATKVLLTREAKHAGWGMSLAAIDKMIASKAKASAKAWSQA